MLHRLFRSTLLFLLLLAALPSAAQVQRYYNNFDAAPTGTLSDFTNVGSANFQVGTVNPISGTHSFSEPSGAANSHIALLTSVAAQQYMSAQVSVTSVGSSPSNNAGAGPVLDSNLAGTTYYQIYFNQINGQAYVIRFNAGTQTVVTGPVATGLSYASGQKYTVKGTFASTGVVSIKIWAAGAGEPTSPVVSVTDSAPLAQTGYAGVQDFVSGAGFPTGYADDFYMGDAGATFSPSGSPLTAPGVSFGSVTGSSVVVNWGGAGGGISPYTYQVQVAPDLAGAPGTWANFGTAGTALTQTVTGLSARRKYWFRVLVTDSAGTPATATGAAAFATTGAAALTGTTYTRIFGAPYGAYAAGLGLGYTIYDGFGNTLTAHTASGVYDYTGTYTTSLTFDTSQSGIIVWDAPPGSAAWSESFSPSQPGATLTVSPLPTLFQPRRGR